MGADRTNDMDLANELVWFLEATREDNRISPVHISLFMAIVQQWSKNDFHNPVFVSANELMYLSKISGRATYYKSLKELNEYGYIHYKPSHNSLKGSFIYLMGCENIQHGYERI